MALPSFGAGLESIFFTEFSGDRVNRINPDGTGFTAVVNGGGPDEVAVDPVGRKIYFTLFSSTTVARADLDGTNVEPLALSQSGASGIALDLANGHVYWAGFGGFVRRSNLDGSDQQTLFTGGAQPDGLALDLVNGHIYFTNRAGSDITRINLDGTNIVNFPVGVSGLRGIAVNPAAGKIYFASFNINGLASMNYDGTGLEVLIPTTGHSGGVEVDLENGHVYFGGNNSSAVLRANLDGTDLVPISVGRQNVLGIAVLPRVNRTIATLGAAAPGLTNTTFRSFGQPVANRTGKVAFSAGLASPTGITTANDQSLWSTLGAGTLKLVAQEGGATGIPGVFFKSWGAPHITDSQFFFRAKLMGAVTSDSDDAICVWNGTTLAILAREGNPSPVGGTWGSLGQPAVNDAGQVLFSAVFKTSGVTRNGLFRSAPSGGSIEAIVLRGDSVQLDGQEVGVKSFTHRAANSSERLISNNGFVGTVLKLADGRTVLAVIAE